MKHVVRTGLAGLLICLALAPGAQAGPTVSVRVEGQAATLLPRTSVTLPDAPEPHTGCPPDSAASALEAATKGNWDRRPFTQTILGETHRFDNNDYWGFWVFRGGRYQVTQGICDERLAAGEELLPAYQIADANFAPTIFPTWLSGVPETVKPGVPFTVTVNRTACETDFCNPGEGHRVAAAGATVRAGGATATADGEGRATLTLTAGGDAEVQATLAGALPTAVEKTCVTSGADGFCGYAIPGGPGSTSTPSSGAGPGTTDTTAPVSRIRGIREGRRFKRRRGPRTLRATVTDGSGLAAVRLSLTRKVKGRCSAFSARRERFVRIRCGPHPSFDVGPRNDVSFLLPARLRTGRYVLDVVGIDVAGNRETLARGSNRIVFTVA